MHPPTYQSYFHPIHNLFIIHSRFPWCCLFTTQNTRSTRVVKWSVSASRWLNCQFQVKIFSNKCLDLKDLFLFSKRKKNCLSHKTFVYWYRSSFSSQFFFFLFWFIVIIRRMKIWIHYERLFLWRNDREMAWHRNENLWKKNNNFFPSRNPTHMKSLIGFSFKKNRCIYSYSWI